MADAGAKTSAERNEEREEQRRMNARQRGIDVEHELRRQSDSG